ncbi:nitrogen assimilation transcription factor nit-4 [Fusarium sporotrichioides]|uniref:Nitrogen assimilation transcription factor nit-4 n=1 Tax=Fusarium sporotrichioides TaxID=5514 RepID=A0A395SQ35_FUSSP|nr:nitrogen assimilation transcription factor nit-4 [Fusarium sporotrichioides]
MEDNGASSRLRTLLPGPVRDGSSGSKPPFKLNIPKRTSVKTACQTCRQRKAKVCDGQRPKCSACTNGGRECQYASHPFEAEAAALKRKHQELQERVSEHEHLYSSLKTREPHETDEILRRIRAGQDVKTVTGDMQGAGATKHNNTSTISRQQANPLIRNDSANNSNSTNTSGSASSPTLFVAHTSFSQAHQPRLTAPHDHPDHVFEEAWRGTQRRLSDDIFVDISGYTLPLSRWTNVHQDDKLLNHLLLLFWTWDTLCNRIIDRSIFEEDLKNLDPTTTSAPWELRFCSPFLVNALLAVSCLYSTNSATFSTPDEISSRGRGFAQEAIRCLKLEDTRPLLPVVQGLGLMYVYEGALGDGDAALEFHSLMQQRYMELRLDDIQRSTDTAIAGSRQRAEAHALSWIQWGFYVWDWKPMHGLCRRFVFKKPAREKTWQQDMAPLNRKEGPEYWWFPYPVSAAPQRSLKRELFDVECTFAEITEQVLEFIIPVEEGVSHSLDPGRAVELYYQLMEWKFSLPEPLRAENAALPAAILLHLSVDLVAISVLQPFDDVPKSTFGPFDPRSTTYAHATNAMSTIWHFRALYTLRNEHWLIQASAVCAFRVLVAIQESPIQLETFIKACRALLELGEAYPVAEQVRYSIESVVEDKGITLPTYAKEYMPHGVGEGVAELTDIKVRDHTVTAEKASEGSDNRFTLTGLLSALAPSEIEPN